MTWISFAAAFLAVIVVLAATGPLLTYTWGVRGYPIVLWGIPLSITFISVSAVVFQTLGIRWNAISVGVLLVSVSLGGFLLRGRYKSPRPTKKWKIPFLWLAIGTALGTASVAARTISALSHPSLVSQTYDVPHHVNLAWSILSTGQGSSLSRNLVGSTSGSSFYPSAWHDLVALVAQVSGSSIPTATNATMIVVASLIWSLGIGLFLRALTGLPTAAFTGAALAGILPQFPAHFLWYVLYPNLLGFVLVPYLLGMSAQILTRPRKQKYLPALLLVLSLPGIALAHPNALFAFAVISAPLFIYGIGLWVYRIKTPNSKYPRTWAAAASLATVIVLLVVNQASMQVRSIAALRTKPHWDALGGKKEALWAALSGRAGWVQTPYVDWQSITVGPIPFLLGALCIVGCLYCFKLPAARWLPFSYITVIALFVIALGVNGPWRPYVIGIWYSDTDRIVALVGLVAAPLAALGACAITDLIVKYLHPPFSTTIVGILVTCSILIAAQFNPLLRASYTMVALNHSFSSNDAMLSRDDLDLLEKVEDIVDPDEVLVGDPWDGSVFSPAYTNRIFAFPSLNTSEGDDTTYFIENLSNALTDPKVCQIANDHNYRFILNLGDDRGEHNGPYGDPETFSPIHDLDNSEIGTVIASSGESQLIEITACEENTP